MFRVLSDSKILISVKHMKRDWFMKKLNEEDIQAYFSGGEIPDFWKSRVLKKEKRQTVYG